MSRETEKQVQT